MKFLEILGITAIGLFCFWPLLRPWVRDYAPPVINFFYSLFAPPMPRSESISKTWAEEAIKSYPAYLGDDQEIEELFDDTSERIALLKQENKDIKTLKPKNPNDDKSLEAGANLEITDKRI